MRAGPFPMSKEKLEDFYRLVKYFKPKIRLPMLVSLLSLVTPEREQDSMEEQMVYMFRGWFITWLCQLYTKIVQTKYW